MFVNTSKPSPATPPNPLVFLVHHVRPSFAQFAVPDKWRRPGNLAAKINEEIAGVAFFFTALVVFAGHVEGQKAQERMASLRSSAPAACLSEIREIFLISGVQNWSNRAETRRLKLAL